MSRTSKVGAVQMSTSPNVDANLLEAERLIRDASEAGAGLVVLPENFAFMGRGGEDQIAMGEAEGQGRLQAFLSRVAEQQRVWLVGGTIPLVAADPGRVRAACLVFDDRGKQVARYDKIHLFDVSLPGGEEHHRESATIEPGTDVVVVDSPFGRLGIAVCYDLRFPELFRLMLDQGVELVAISAAFTALTGKAHWETLVRARAIENLAYVIAAAQVGLHQNGRETYGHSMVVDPWGSILAEASQGVGFTCGAVDPELQRSVRRSFPAIEHRRFSCDRPSVKRSGPLS